MDIELGESFMLKVWPQNTLIFYFFVDNVAQLMMRERLSYGEHNMLYSI